MVPLNDAAVGALDRARAVKVPNLTYVFTYKGEPFDDYRVAWYKALDRAGLKNFTWHGFRHTFNTWLAQKGVPVEIRRRLCGWSSREISDRYTHLGVEHLRVHTAIIDQMLASLPVRSQTTGVQYSQYASA